MPDQNCSIVLVGFMGAGKSTVGKVLAKALGYEFVDLDEAIVKAQGKTIPDIFAEEGESVFRDYETDVLKSFLESRNIVLSTGGGAVGKEVNFKLMRSIGPVVYLKADWQVLQERVIAGEGRPLAAEGLDKLRRLLENRLPLYAKADYIVESEQGNPEEVAKSIIRLLKSGESDA